MSYGMEYLFGQLGQLGGIPRLLTAGAEQETESFDAVQALFSIMQNIVV